MSPLCRATVIATCLAILTAGCASDRVRGGQGTEMGQAEEYEPEKKVDPPIGNVDRTSGPLEHPEPYPVLEVDLERRRPPPGPGPEPEPEPTPEPQPEPEPENPE
jgi:hypothetical protein